MDMDYVFPLNRTTVAIEPMADGDAAIYPIGSEERPIGEYLLAYMQYISDIDEIEHANMYGGSGIIYGELMTVTTDSLMATDCHKIMNMCKAKLHDICTMQTPGYIIAGLILFTKTEDCGNIGWFTHYAGKLSDTRLEPVAATLGGISIDVTDVITDYSDDCYWALLPGKRMPICGFAQPNEKRSMSTAMAVKGPEHRCCRRTQSVVLLRCRTTGIYDVADVLRTI